MTGCPKSGTISRVEPVMINPAQPAPQIQVVSRSGQFSKPVYSTALSWADLCCLQSAMHFVYVGAIISVFLGFQSPVLALSEKDIWRRQSNWTVGQAVQTSSGLIQGHPAVGADEVSEYLGIPFAQPPVGSLRWAAPLRYNGTSGIKAAKFVSLLQFSSCPCSINLWRVGPLLSSCLRICRYSQ